MSKTPEQVVAEAYVQSWDQHIGKDGAAAVMDAIHAAGLTISDYVPGDVRKLVIAARIVSFEDHSPEAIRELDAASEAFSERVPWDE